MSELYNIKGIGPKTLHYLNKLNINDIDSLVSHYPFRYEMLERSNINILNQDDKIIIDGVIESLPIVNRFGRNLNKMSFNINVGNKILKINIFNRAFMSNNIIVGRIITVIGKYDKKNNSIIANQILFSKLGNDKKIIPIYRTTTNLKKATLSNIIKQALNNYEPIDYIPNNIIEKYSFLDKYKSIYEAHNPSSMDNLNKALLRLKYEELFVFMLRINNLINRRKKEDNKSGKNINMNIIKKFINKLPFILTDDQVTVVNEIIDDLNSNRRMSRLIQGDVGSGKTIVSFIAAYGVMSKGYQCAFMVPTEILATQHYNNAINLFEKEKVVLLTGSIKKNEKMKVYEKIKNKEVDLIIGTHALIEEQLQFNNLGLVITDEQHRFGVYQRDNLKNKGQIPDILYMSATPIPRTYALTIYGDMDISIIKTLPKCRKETITYIKDEKEIKDILYMIKDELDNKHQVYVVAPLIEDEEESEKDNIMKLKRQYDMAFKSKNIEVLHGKMKSTEKEEVMNKFVSGEIDILISTTVIEVGVDVKNASMIVIHSADFFGLSTLHQLRGRVGRGNIQSKCVLIGNKDNRRLQIMKNTNDGFVISEEDFKLRGFGDLFGYKQSGDMEFKLADFKKDYKILLAAKKDSMEFLNSNQLKDYKHIKELLDEHLS